MALSQPSFFSLSVETWISLQKAPKSPHFVFLRFTAIPLTSFSSFFLQPRLRCFLLDK
ncbi:hypothetical protein SLEP1_g59970 [Rubroshorea leprosula]|uniref:Uncharacterized protein n=1 Tax=Rubroshorea leprosula TaxID=152421 RepID=A0AAV5MXK4_9ROSI|nr:hypothetical protein SLEP1_g59970 [Rubroshorea leprosula]